MITKHGLIRSIPGHLADVERAQRVIFWWPDWVSEAECRKYPMEWFYDYGRNKLKIRRAKWVCSQCPVKDICLQENVTIPFGIFGGLTWLERWRYLGNTGYPTHLGASSHFAALYTVSGGKLQWLYPGRRSRERKRNT